MKNIIKLMVTSFAVFFFSFFVDAFAAGIELPRVTALFGYEIGKADYAPQKPPADLKQAELWKAVEDDIDELATLAAGQTKKAGAGSGAAVVQDAAAILHKIKGDAEALYGLNPNGAAEKGILGSSIVGEFFYPNYLQFVATGRVGDTTVLNKAISLLLEVKKDGHFPKASRDLAVAYVFQNRYNDAFNEYKNVLERFPDNRDYAEAVVAIFAFQLPGLDGDAKVKLAKEYSSLLSKWISKTRSAAALDYLFLAKIYSAAGDLKKTAKYVNKGLKKFPADGLLLEAQKAVNSSGNHN